MTEEELANSTTLTGRSYCTRVRKSPVSMEKDGVRRIAAGPRPGPPDSPYVSQTAAAVRSSA